MRKQERKTKGITANLKLLILEEDLKKIKSLKYPEKSKVFKQYSDLLLNVIKNIEVPKKINETNFNSIESLEKEIDNS